MPTDMNSPVDTNPLTAGIAQAVEQAQYAGLTDEERKAKEAEYDAVKELWKEYEEAREFDKDARRQFVIDRSYAAGTQDRSWAVNTNLIGSSIDVLTSFLYARNPDVSVRKAPRVDNRGTKQDEDFARTMELVISSLWKRAPLKRNARKQVRSALSVGPGWLKVIMVAESPNHQQMTNEMNDLRKNVEDLEAARNELLSQQNFLGAEEKNTLIQREQELIASLTERTEAAIRKYLAVDFCSAEDVQVSLNVRSISDYLDADWIANAIYRPRKSIPSLFPAFQDETKAKELDGATEYVQRKPDPQPPPISTEDKAFGGVTPEQAEQYIPGLAGGNTDGGNGCAFLKIVELWDRRTNHIKTMIEGVKCWAKEPYQPPYPTTRFYPHFYLGFYEVDSARYPQSLPWRLQKLQDEYARSRSNFRLTRERSIPGVLVDGTGLSPDEVSKVTQSVHQEITVLKPVRPGEPLGNLFAPKPIGNYDPRIYDTIPIIQDMERISGVQEALQSTQMSTPVTATEASIQQSGFASRTSADRDVLEGMLNELALYTAEVALSALNTRDVQRICGAKAFWPEGLAMDDLLTLVEVQIEAGTTGKPRAAGDQNAWGVILPQLTAMIGQIYEAMANGNIPLAQSLSEMMRETMVRMGDDTDIERFIPAVTDMGMPPMSLPGAGSMMPPADGLPPAAPSGEPVGGAASPAAPPELMPGGEPAGAALL